MKTDDYDLLILGAGAAGLMAAIAAADCAAAHSHTLRIAILEKNAQPGVKILVCGGGRCNLTNAGSVDFLIAQFGRNGRFLTPALRHLSNDALRDWFASQSVPTHEEHHGKIYPNSNLASSVVKALVQRCHALNIQILSDPRHAATAVAYSPPPQNSEFSIQHSAFFSITTQSATLTARSLLIAVGGQSYTRMGTTGDGYRFAQSLGHTLVTPRPAIVGLLCQEDWPKTLQGLAVPNVQVKIELPPGKKLPTLATGKPTPSLGALLFTHFGLSGPAILNPSEIVAELLEKLGPDPGITLKIDFARHFSHEELTNLLKSWQQNPATAKKPLKKLLSQPTPDITINSTRPDATWSDPQLNTTPLKDFSIQNSKFSIPHRLAEKLLDLTQLPPLLPAAQLTTAHIHRLIDALKASRFTIHATRGFKEAMVTAGGVALPQVDPNTMQSKLVPHLYFAGEVLDLTGPSGGYNLQLAFSTGHLAGTSAAARLISTATPNAISDF